MRCLQLQKDRTHVPRDNLDSLGSQDNPVSQGTQTGTQVEAAAEV